ncbi:hypothetical protein DUI87_33752 [Hirundo rustica rustica]|uniref:HSF-type DNA-binding domain-containing protein n=1 Tax=Hirundo rustica rustica TaxID=333673 RepID=A0A3M0IN51_HIRRU|nr:hypothetical protein DUI87_33752 [Hirundo rustica rustica]
MTPCVCSLRWDSEARGLLVDRSLFERELLRPGGAQGPAPHAFRATQFRSFVRQLYRYGFRKVPGWAGAVAPGDAGAWFHYSNPWLRRDRPDLLLRIRRQSAANTQRRAAGQEGRSPPPCGSQQLPGPRPLPDEQHGRPRFQPLPLLQCPIPPLNPYPSQLSQPNHMAIPTLHCSMPCHTTPGHTTPPFQATKAPATSPCTLPAIPGQPQLFRPLWPGPHHPPREQVHPHIPTHFASKHHQDIACVLLLQAHANRLSQPPLPLLFQPLAHKLQVHLLPGPPAQPQARAGPLPDTSAVAAMLAAPRRLKLQEPLHTAPADAQPATPGLSVQGRGLHSIILLPPSQLGLGVSSRCCQSSWGWARSGTAPTFPSLGHHPAGSSKVPLCDITVLAAPTFHALETLQGKRPEPHPVIKLTRH